MQARRECARIVAREDGAWDGAQALRCGGLYPYTNLRIALHHAAALRSMAQYSRSNRYAAICWRRSAFLPKGVSASIACLVSLAASLRDFSRPTMAGKVAFSTAASLPAVLPNTSVDWVT